MGDIARHCRHIARRACLPQPTAPPRTLYVWTAHSWRHRCQSGPAAARCGPAGHRCCSESGTCASRSLSDGLPRRRGHSQAREKTCRVVRGGPLCSVGLDVRSAQHVQHGRTVHEDQARPARVRDPNEEFPYSPVCAAAIRRRPSNPSHRGLRRQPCQYATRFSVRLRTDEDQDGLALRQELVDRAAVPKLKEGHGSMIGCRRPSRFPWATVALLRFYPACRRLRSSACWSATGTLLDPGGRPSRATGQCPPNTATGQCPPNTWSTGAHDALRSRSPRGPPRAPCGATRPNAYARTVLREIARCGDSRPLWIGPSAAAYRTEPSRHPRSRGPQRGTWVRVGRSLERTA